MPAVRAGAGQWWLAALNVAPQGKRDARRL
jgi:hypothetical protein